MIYYYPDLKYRFDVILIIYNIILKSTLTPIPLFKFLGIILGEFVNWH